MPVNRFDRTASGDDADPEETDKGFDRGGPEAVHRLQAQLEELGEHARMYVQARKDAMLATSRKLVLWALAGIIGFAVLCTMLITATVLGMTGLAQVIGVGLGDRAWAGNLIAGFGLLLLVAVGLVVSIRLVQSRFHKQTVKKYAQRHQAQRSRFGHDVGQAGSEAERN